MRYFKQIGGRLSEYSGPQMGAAWYANNEWLPYAGTLGTDWLYVDAAGAIAELSPEEFAALHPVIPHELVDGEKVITAVYDLIPSSTIAAVMSSPDAVKEAVKGLTLLTTNAAPDGMIDLLDSRVAAWLSLAGLTLDQVKNKMAEAQP